MAEDKKSDSSEAASSPPEVIDDWDSLPLDPDGDDWDDLPPPKADPGAIAADSDKSLFPDDDLRSERSSAELGPIRGPESTSPPVLAAPIPPAADPPSIAKLPPGAAPPPDSGQIFALLGADDFKTEDFGDQPLDPDSDLDDSALPSAEEMDEFDLPAGLGSGDSLAPDESSTETPDEDFDFDVLLSAVPAAEADDDGLDGVNGTADFSGPNESDSGAGTDYPAEAATPPVPADFPDDMGGSPPAGSEAGEEDSAPDDFAPLETMPLGGGAEPAQESPDDRAATSMLEKIEAELDDLPTKKVELDIEGIFLEDHDPPPAEEEEPPPEPEPLVEAATPVITPFELEEAPLSRKIPKLKLLMVLAPVLLLVFGLGFGVYKLFFSSPADEGPAPLVIDPAVPFREPLPGSLDLGAFYVNFPGERSETIMEMTVVLYYKDLPDRAAIEARRALVRDIIYLVAQGQGSQVISNGEAQRQLRQIATEQANAALGGEHIDYIQISQIRILQ